MNQRVNVIAVLFCAIGIALGGVSYGAAADEDDAYGPGMMGGGYGYGMHRGYGGGYGMMGGPGMGMEYGMMGVGPMYMLDLSEAQRNKIHTIDSATRRAHFAIMEKMADEHDKLWKIYGADTLDVNAAMKVYDRIFDLRRQMLRSSLDAAKQMEGVLTKEQREQMKTWRHGGGWGYHRRGNPPAGMQGPMLGR